jgi:uncharacterized protein (DUF697 family)
VSVVLERVERHGVLIDAAEITAGFSKLVTASKNDLLAVARRVAPECVGGTAGQIEATIAKGIRDALRHIAEHVEDNQQKGE